MPKRPKKPKVNPGRDTERFFCGEREVIVTRRSITDLRHRVGAIVCSDDNYLSHGGGLAGDVWNAAGPDLGKHLDAESAKLAAGDIYRTPGFDVNADWIFHIVTLDLDGRAQVSAPEMHGVFRRLLYEAGGAGCHDVALAMIGTGMASIDPLEILHGLMTALELWIDLPMLPNRVIVTAPDHYDLVVESAKRRFSYRPALEELLYSTAARLGWEEEDYDRNCVENPWWQHRRNDLRIPPYELAEQFDGFLGSAAKSLAAAVFDRHARRELSDEGLANTTMRVRAAPQPDVRPLKNLSAVSPSLSTDLDVLESSARGIGLAFSSSLRLVLQDAIHARNLITHGVHARIGFETWSAITVGLRALFQFLAGIDDLLEPKGRQLPQPIGVCEAPAAYGSPESPRMDRETTDRAPSLLAEAHATKEVTRREVPPTANVRALHRFMEENLSEARLKQLDAEIEQAGHTGDHSLRRLEHWLLVPDPIQVLVEEFRPHELRRFVEAITGRRPDPSASPMDLARKIAMHLGFPALSLPLGLQVAENETERALNTILTGSELEYRGAVTTASQQLERVCQILLEFVCRVAFQKVPEKLFQQLGRLASHETVRKASLGKLTELLSVLQSELDQSDLPTVKTFERDFGTRQIFPKPSSGLAGLRNAVTHYQAVQASAGEVRQQALAFVKQVKQILVALKDAEPRVFPRVIAVQEVRIDKWQRRFVRVLTDAGREETLFTDEPLEPGQVYFMHPLNNPVRIDPILVPAGDLS